MIRCIGTKLVLAKPMSRGEYNAYRAWTPPTGEDQEVDGYLIEYEDGGEANDPRHIGYISWTPKDVFRKSYRPIEAGLTFGMAIEAMKLGKKVARGGWNGKGMYLYFVPEGRYPPTTVAARQIAEKYKDGCVPYDPYIAMKTVGETVVPWLASQTDILAEDWTVLD